MAQDADNDNGTRSAIDAIRAAAPNWTDYGPGGTALASSATANQATDAPAHNAADQDHVAPDPLVAEQPAHEYEERANAALPAADEPAPVQQQTVGARPHFAVTNAVSLDELGIGLKQRPTPRRAATQPMREPPEPVRSSAVSAPPLRSPQRNQAQRPPSPTGPLFNTPPEPPMTERADAFADAAFSAATSNERTLTSQPGFLLGLISAAVAGAGLYIYLT